MVIQKKASLPFKSIGIIGLGIIGGSIAQAIKANDPGINIYTMYRDSADNAHALKTHLVNKEWRDLKEFIVNIEFLILATPIETIVPIAKQIEQYKNLLNNKLIVIDIGSVKHDISQSFESLTSETIEFVPTHPMSGSDKQGFSGIKTTLFVNNPWIITPHKKNGDTTIDSVKKFITYLGGTSLILDSQKHDKYAGIVSHLTFLISTYLFAFASEKEPEALSIAGPGFKKTTRLAKGNAKMHNQILIHNYDNIHTSLKQFLAFIESNPVTRDNALEFFEKYKKERDRFI